MNRLFTVVTLFLTYSVFSQTFQVENTFEMVFRKSKVNSKNEWKTASLNIHGPSALKKIQIRFEINTLSGKKEVFDPNKFYLVSELNKIRVRPVDFTFHDYAHVFTSFEKLSCDPVEKNKFGLTYDPEIKDFFNDYKIAGYTDIDNEIDFGTKKKALVVKTYSKPIEWKSNLIDIYAFIPENLNSIDIYYGSQKLMLVELKE